MALVQVVPGGNAWNVILDGEQQGGSYATQEQADQAGRALARQNSAEYQLHGADGQIRDKDSYGNDPRDVKG